MATRDRTTRGGTPGRRTNITENQYFDIGLRGRKTGITLKDTGIRDDYGLEPVSGIFSSGGSRVSAYSSDDDGSAEMDGLDSPRVDVSDTLQRRRDPRFSLPRSPIQRKTNATASPGRQSSILQSSPASRQLANRKLDIQSGRVRVSIEKRSPFKPTHVLRRSMPGESSQQNVRQSLGIPLPDFSSPGSTGSVRRVPSARKRTPNPIFYDDEDPDVDGGTTALQYATGDEIEGALGDAGNMLLSASPTTPRKRHRQSEQVHEQATATRQRVSTDHVDSNKRPRFSEPPDDQDEYTYASIAGPSSHRQAEALPIDDGAPYNDYNYDQGDYDDDDGDDDDDGGSPGFPVPESEDEVSARGSPSPARPAPRVNGKGKARASPLASPPRQARAAPQPRSRRQESAGSGGDYYHSDSSSGSSYEGGKKRKGTRGSRSNVHYRATTPFNDAGKQTTRSGRAIIKPLNWWEGEAVIWKNGEVDGVIRATSVEPERRVVKKRAQHKKKTKKIKEGLDAIAEQDEDQVPSDWEDEIGVMTGDVAPWDTELNAATEEELVTEDIAFAASSITLRSTNGASFNYAKIQTLPFFGSGVVEIPPGGVKNMKNSRKMQMNFFVHKGKVQVTLTTPTSASTSIFSITEGGAWIVPRGNNYIINNHSSSTTAFLFFSQGCEVLPDDGE